jgi:hypothetical protein
LAIAANPLAEEAAPESGASPWAWRTPERAWAKLLTLFPSVPSNPPRKRRRPGGVKSASNSVICKKIGGRRVMVCFAYTIAHRQTSADISL